MKLNMSEWTGWIKKAGESKGGVRATFAGHIGRQSRPKTPCLSHSSPY